MVAEVDPEVERIAELARLRQDAMLLAELARLRAEKEVGP